MAKYSLKSWRPGNALLSPATAGQCLIPPRRTSEADGSKSLRRPRLWGHMREVAAFACDSWAACTSDLKGKRALEGAQQQSPSKNTGHRQKTDPCLFASGSQRRASLFGSLTVEDGRNKEGLVSLANLLSMLQEKGLVRFFKASRPGSDDPLSVKDICRDASAKQRPKGPGALNNSRREGTPGAPYRDLKPIGSPPETPESRKIIMSPPWSKEVSRRIWKTAGSPSKRTTPDFDSISPKPLILDLTIQDEPHYAITFKFLIIKKLGR